MADLKWATVKRQMRFECKRVAEAWDVPVENVSLEFGIHSEEPDEFWVFRVRHPDARFPWGTSASGITFKEAAVASVELAEAVRDA